MDEAEATGCQHYQRKCSLLAPCCDRFYVCRFCHDEEENHTLCRNQVQKVKCLKCQHVAEVQSHCLNCNEQFARYFCEICRLYDEKDKGQFHCDGCGICRVGGRDNFFHCSKCDMCLGIHLQNKHKCVEKVSKANCPVCMEDLHSSRIAAHVPSCGHLLHSTCFEDYVKSGGYTCPLCGQSMLSMRNVWRMLDQEVQNTRMPEEYANYRVQILCRDCHKECRVLFHVIGLKCQHCGSYNTCRTAEDDETLNSVVPSQEEDDHEDGERQEENAELVSDGSEEDVGEDSANGSQADQAEGSPVAVDTTETRDESTDDTDSWETAEENDGDPKTV